MKTHFIFLPRLKMAQTVLTTSHLVQSLSSPPIVMIGGKPGTDLLGLLIIELVFDA